MNDQDKLTVDRINAFLEADSPFHRLIDARVESIDEQRVVCRLPIRPEFFHAGGVLHGGITYALADSAVAMLVLYNVGFDRQTFTIEGKLNYLASVPMGSEGELAGEARVVSLGRTTAVVDADVHGHDGRHLCHGIFTYAIR